MDVNLEDRAKGVLVGAAVGDALGMPREFGYVRGPVAGIVEGRLPAGSFTDDTEMMIALGESLVVNKGINAADVAKRFVDWYNRYPSDIGITTSRVLAALDRGERLEKVATTELALHPNAAANGSLMRCFPVALAYHDDFAGCVEASALQSRITHPHRDCIDVCIVANSFIWHVLQGASKQEAFEQALAQIENNPTLQNTLRQDLEPGVIPLGGGGAVVTMRAALWSVMVHDSYADAVLTVVNNCGDPDTVGCVTGALAGALYGLSGIPQEWRTRLHGDWPIKTGNVVRSDFFSALALELIAIGGQS